MVDQCTDMVEQCVSLQQLQNKLEERMDKLDMPDHDVKDILKWINYYFVRCSYLRDKAEEAGVFKDSVDDKLFLEK